MWKTHKALIALFTLPSCLVFMMTLNVPPHPSETPRRLDYIYRETQCAKFRDPPCLMHAFISYSYDNGICPLQRRGEEVDPPLVHQLVFFHVCLFLCLFTRVGVQIV